MAEEASTKSSENDERGKTMATSVGTSSPPEVQPKPSDAKAKDAWDKAQIISGFVSSVVIAAVGLLITSSIQRAEMRASTESARAQIEITDRNNKAQLALTERNADIQKRLQESTLTRQLVEHLAGDSALKKQIAIVALRRSVPSDMYQDVITIVVRSDTDAEVRKTALQQAATLRDAERSVVQAISEAAKDSNRSGEERQIATDTVHKLGFNSITSGSNTFVLSSTSGAQLGQQSSDLGGGVFTYYLVRGLSRDASIDGDEFILLRALGQFVLRSVTQFTNGNQMPMYFDSGVGDGAIFGPGANFSKTIVVAIGNSDYSEPGWDLAFSASDATRFAEVCRRQGAVVRELQDATRLNFWDAIQSTIRDVDDGSLLIFYYSGHSAVVDGTFWLLPVDVDPDRLATTAISTADLNQSLHEAPAQVKVLFLDTAFSGVVQGVRAK